MSVTAKSILLVSAILIANQKVRRVTPIVVQIVRTTKIVNHCQKKMRNKLRMSHWKKKKTKSRNL